MNFFGKVVNYENNEEMFNFVKKHYTYLMGRSYCGENRTIANYVKLYSLKLEGDWKAAQNFLNKEEYCEIDSIIRDWKKVYPGYNVHFDGTSGGYLVLEDACTHDTVLPDFITANNTYKEYVEYCNEYECTVEDNKKCLVELVKDIQEFDKLCDELRDYVNELSKQDFAQVECETIVEDFNSIYEDDLSAIKCGDIKVSEDKKGIDITNIAKFKSLVEAFLKVADRTDYCYDTILTTTEDGKTIATLKY